MLAMAFAARAQWDMYAFYRTYGDRYAVFTNKMMPTSDNCVIFDSELYINDGVCTESNYIGSVLYKADCGGDVVDSLFIPAPMFVANCNSACFRHPTVANATAFTSISNVNDSLFFRILTVSDDLDIVSDIAVPLLNYPDPNAYVRSILDPDNNIVVSLETQSCSVDGTSNYVVMAKLNVDGEFIVEPKQIEIHGNDSRFKGVFNTNPLQYIYTSVELGDYIDGCTGSYAEIIGYQATITDENFNVVKEIDLPKTIGNVFFEPNRSEYLYMDDESFVFASVVDASYQYGYFLVAKFDHDGNLIEHYKSYNIGQNLYNQLWLCANEDEGIIVTETKIENNDKYIIVACHDKDDLSKKWEKRISGFPSEDGIDFIYGVETLDNGVTAFLVNGVGTAMNIMVLFVEGFTSVDESAVETVTSFCSPNPASNVINIENPSGAKIESVSLYDISGRLVKTQHSDLGTIDISGFAPGMYILKLSLENGSVFEEKIIKR